MTNIELTEDEFVHRLEHAFGVGERFWQIAKTDFGYGRATFVKGVTDTSGLIAFGIDDKGGGRQYTEVTKINVGVAYDVSFTDPKIVCAFCRDRTFDAIFEVTLTELTPCLRALFKLEYTS